MDGQDCCLMFLRFCHFLFCASCGKGNPNFLLERIPERVSERKSQSTEFNLVTATRFDREKKDVYAVTVTCRDEGQRSQTSSVTLRVQIADVNDHAPKFPTDSVAFEVRENSPIGTEVGRVEARDKDSGENAQIVYTLEERGEQLLTINRTTGIITTQALLDHELSVDYTFNVVARDRGDPPRSVILRASLTILDEDDERPTFSASRYIFTVYENQPPGTEVGQVVAVDRDSVPFDRFIYFLDRRSKGSLTLFEIEARTGTIKTKQVLDRENTPIHYVTIVVSPDSDPTYSATASVTINIGDMNDNKPRFLYPATNNETVTVSSQTPRGHTLKHIKGSDPDAGQNGNLTYTMTKGNPKGGMFLLDPQTGSLVVNADLSAIDFQEVFLSLLVQDGGSPSLSTTAELRIVISKDVPFMEKNRRLSLLANENMVVVLAITLAAILVAITVITVVIVLVRMEDRRRKAKVKQSLVTNGEVHSSVDGPMPPFHMNDARNQHPMTDTTVFGLQPNGIKSSQMNCQLEETALKRIASVELDEDNTDIQQRFDGRSGGGGVGVGGGGGGKPVVVFIKDQREGEGYFYGNQDSEEEEEEGVAEVEEPDGFSKGEPQTTNYTLRLFDNNTETKMIPTSVHRIGNAFCPTAVDGSGSDRSRYVHQIFHDGRMPSFRFGGQRSTNASTATTGSDKAPDVTKTGFFDRTFPTRKPFHGGCKIGDLHHLSRHSYSDLDCRYDGSNLIKSTTTSSLRVHFALEEDSVDHRNFDCSRSTVKAPLASLPVAAAERNYGYCGVGGRTKAFRLVNGNSCSSVHNDYEV